MALIDSEGRVTIGVEIGKKYDFLQGKEIALVMVDDKLYRLEDASYKEKEGEYVVACEFPTIDEKCRFFVPKTLRKMFTREAVVLENKGHLYLKFFRLKSDEEWLRMKLLASMTDDRK